VITFSHIVFVFLFFVTLFFLVHFQPRSNGGYLYSMTLMSIFLISHDNLYLFIYLFNYLFFLFSINLFSTSHLKNGQHFQEIKKVFSHFASKYDNKNLLYLMWKIEVVNSPWNSWRYSFIIEAKFNYYVSLSILLFHSCLG
jgi:H+/Cl- antiporter ClcA